MAFTLKKAEASELGPINALIVDSEMASVGKEDEKTAFAGQYRVSEGDLLTTLSYAVYEDGRLVGFFMVKHRQDEPELEYFYVEHHRLGRGYGKVMWRHVEQVCAQAGIHTLKIVCAKNVTAFYLKMGAQVIGEGVSKVYRGAKIDLLRCELASP